MAVKLLTIARLLAVFLERQEIIFSQLVTMSIVEQGCKVTGIYQVITCAFSNEELPRIY